MTGSTHKIGGFTFGMLFITLNLYLPTMPIVLFSVLTPVFLTGCILGALFPDIDHPQSTISRYLWFIAWPIWVTQSIIKGIFKNKKSTFAKNICKTVGHRGIAHWLMLAIPYLVIIVLIATFSTNFRSMFSLDICFQLIAYFLYGTAVGNFSHIILDAFNDRGIALFAPFSFKRFHFARVKTGHRLNKHTIFTTSTSENVFIIILLLICVALIAYNLHILAI